MANKPSSTITRKIDLTTEAVVWARGLRAALHLSLRSTPTTPITSAMNGALIMPTLKCVIEIASLQPGHEDLRAHAAVEPGNDAAAVERGHRAEEASRGSAMTSAMTRGRTRTSIGSKPIVRSASISSRIFIEPSSAV